MKQPPPVAIGILGSGTVGATLGDRFAARGHEVIYGVRDPGADRIRELLDGHPGRARAVGLDEVAATAPVLLLAVPWEAVESTLEKTGPLDGKILIDATNPLLPNLAGLAVTGDDSGGESVARLARGARVVKAFNTIGSAGMADPVYGGRAAFLPVVADDDEARETVVELARDLGFDAIDFGPLRHARYTEALAMSWIWLAHRGGEGADFAFLLTPREPRR